LRAKTPAGPKVPLANKSGRGPRRVSGF
jgi:hypothetical protein